MPKPSDQQTQDAAPALSSPSSVSECSDAQTNADKADSDKLHKVMGMTASEVEIYNEIQDMRQGKVNEVLGDSIVHVDEMMKLKSEAANISIEQRLQNDQKQAETRRKDKKAFSSKREQMTGVDDSTVAILMKQDTKAKKLLGDM